MAYNELIKNFETIRNYMREFYIYGFKCRGDFHRRSPRSYDEARRRVESWLGDYMQFHQDGEGKNVFLSIDSQSIAHDPLYESWKACTFTDKDITLHFLLMDQLWSPEECRSAAELVDGVYAALDRAEIPMEMEESTILKKLREYVRLGLLTAEKEGRRLLYRRSETAVPEELTDALDFFSEAAPCGVVGSFLLDRLPSHGSAFTFKHHYIFPTLDSDVMAELLDAMQKKCAVRADNQNRYRFSPTQVWLVPLKIYISTQTGRQYLMAYNLYQSKMQGYRLDYLSRVKKDEVQEDFDDLRRRFEEIERYLWGVNIQNVEGEPETVEMTLVLRPWEEYVADRLLREKRCGTVTRLDEAHVRFSARVWNAEEMLPWLRTFLGRIEEIHFSNPETEAHFREGVQEMYRIYGLDEEETP